VITSLDGRRSWLSRALNLLGVAVVAFFAARDALPNSGPWVTALVVLALACWVVTIVLPRPMTALGTAVLTVMVLAGAAVTVPTNGILVIAVAVGVVRAVVDLERPLWQGLALGLVAAVVVPISALYSPVTPLGIVSIEAGVVVALLAGLSRRQFRASETQARQLLEERVAAREEFARATVLASRQHVARDIHDVLAHSLGGLVIQLDAVDALLEAGRTDDAAERVRDARALAVSGLAEARRAVDALREDAAVDLVGELTQLAETHRTLGGTVELSVSGSDAAAPALGADAVEAFRRAFQEALTNARKHAPGRPVVAEFARRADGAATLRVENPLPAATGGASAGGHGLAGMAERFDALPGGSVTAGAREGRFVVLARMEAP
jgi:signal transduction histidine kinase